MGGKSLGIEIYIYIYISIFLIKKKENSFSPSVPVDMYIQAFLGLLMW